ncbi:DUF1445 domain-containing protein [Hypoxylon sp. NC1633]|nr:DUF1445 domain-containing protein [Hypoxylon sp. NC1633]
MATVSVQPQLGLELGSKLPEDKKSPSTGTGRDVRLLIRKNEYTSGTAGLAPTYLQANLLILPSCYADDFRLLCARNPVPCPLIAESSSPGDYSSFLSKVPDLSGSRMLGDIDICRDVPRYNVYRNSRLAEPGLLDVTDEWADDHVAFLIGCSYSFESALQAAGLPPRHQVQGRHVPVYRTSIPLAAAGIFSAGSYVVSMRPYKKADIPRVREITRAYNATHGEPIAWGWDALERLGIRDIDSVDWCDPPLTTDGRPLGQVWGSDDDVPVFWGCGVTPQEAVMNADIQGTAISHMPGHMLVLDARDDDITGLKP